MEAREESLKTKKTEAFPNIQLQDYALIWEGNRASRIISMKQTFGGFQFIHASIKVLKSGFFVPMPAVFMLHYKNVNKALKAETILYDASGGVIDGTRLVNYANALNTDCWVLLNAMTKKGEGFRGLDLVRVAGLNKGRPVMDSAPLENCLEKDCFAELDSLNKQGFPTKKSRIQIFEPGKTFYFWPPRVDSVARFYACSGKAGIGWGKESAEPIPSLGLFECADADARKYEFLMSGKKKSQRN